MIQERCWRVCTLYWKQCEVIETFKIWGTCLYPCIIFNIYLILNSLLVIGDTKNWNMVSAFKKFKTYWKNHINKQQQCFVINVTRKANTMCLCYGRRVECGELWKWERGHFIWGIVSSLKVIWGVGNSKDNREWIWKIIRGQIRKIFHAILQRIYFILKSVTNCEKRNPGATRCDAGGKGKKMNILMCLLEQLERWGLWDRK